MNNTHAIAHRVEVEVPVSRLFAAVAEPKGIAAWWTPMVEPHDNVEVGSVLRIRFGNGKHGPDMRIDALAQNERVVWTCVEGPWKGHQFAFETAEHERGSVLRFFHSNWTESSDFFMHCNCKWGYFLAVSLKSYLETGRGTPHPLDPKI